MGLEDLLKKAAPALWVGAGAALASPRFRSKVVEMSRPVAKVIIRTYLAVRDELQGTFAEASEQWSDLVAEVQAERTSQQADVVAETNSPPEAVPAAGDRRESPGTP